jgi:hypothetical protein
MTAPRQELLLIRLDTLGDDIGKVATAIDRAKGRGDEINAIITLLSGEAQESTVLRPLRQLSGLVDELREVLREYPDIQETIDDMEGPELLQRLAGANAEFDRIRDRLIDARARLRRIRKAIVPMGDWASSESLSNQCAALQAHVKTLRCEVEEAGADPVKQREFWNGYEVLLVEQAQPLFGEYVDFLGGLTLRDTGLDDRVCEMTDVLLGGFKTVTRHYLPIPSRNAALSSALDSVVKLGFPEWTLWGVPLVAHEVGLALADDRRADDVQGLLEKWVRTRPVGEVTELFADAFGAYTIGPAYGYAAMLMRLQPHHDEPSRPDEARDVDRARLILGVLRVLGEPGTTYRGQESRLKEIWKSAVVTLAEPGAGQRAASEADGPVAADDWLDDFLAETLELFKRRSSIQPFNDNRWSDAQAKWNHYLCGSGSPPQMQEEASDVLALLNLAWAARIEQPDRTKDVAALVEQVWQSRKRSGRDGGFR